MAIPSRQIGGSTTTNLLWQISKQLEELICVRTGNCGGTTTTTSTTAVPIECIVYNAANGNIYIYDVTTNLSVEILNGGASPNFQVANTDTKLWTAQGGGYVQEYDLTFTPGPVVTYNRSISTGTIINNGTFAIDDTTLIVCDAVTLGIYELDITTTTATSTFKGNIEAGYIATDMLLTTSGKLIIVAVDIATVSITKVYQYNYATWTLETTLDLTSQLPALNYGAGIAQYLGNIYIFTRVEVCNPTSTPSGVYLLDVLTNNVTLVDSTGFGCGSGASSWLACNTTSLNPCLQCSLPDVTIGTQTWSACNLNVTTYQNGDPIPQVQDPVEWAALTTGAWCYYDNDADNGCTYGKLYNWYAVNDPRGLAPAGYHVPTDSDFTTLYTYLGGEAAAGGALKEAGLAHWIAPNTDATNSSGFTALPGGVRNVPSGAFNLLGVYGFWWSATDNGTGVYSLQLLYNDGGVVGWGTPYFKTDGHSVRLIKDSSITTTTSTTTLAPTGFNTIYTHFESL
jgi:uncharacterized protein (TIGR02145 family)